MHARAAAMVGEAAAWERRVAALDQPDEELAAELEQLADGEAAASHPALAATHLQWASDISPARVGRERRLLTAALHLTLAGESAGAALHEAAAGTAPSPLRGCLLDTIAYSSGQLTEAERQFGQALVQAQQDPDSQPLAALIANHLAGTYSPWETARRWWLSGGRPWRAASWTRPSPARRALLSRWASPRSPARRRAGRAGPSGS